MDWWQYVDTFPNSVCNKIYRLVTDLSCVCVCVLACVCLCVKAAYLQKGGLKTAVLERRHVLGGAAVTEEIVPGRVPSAWGS